MKLLFLLAVISLPVVSFSQSLSEKLNQYFEAAQKAGIFNGSVMIAKGEVDKLILHQNGQNIPGKKVK